MRYGRCQVIDVVLAASATPDYSSGDSVGGLVTLGAIANAFGQGVLKSIVVIDQANQKQPLTLLFFDSLPAGTYTDNAAIGLTAADAAKCVAKVDVAAADYETVSSLAIANVECSKVVKGTADTARTLYLLVMAGGTINLAAVTDLKLRIALLVD